jgi:ABC-type dipeptide/oligopeptide/nickel transport system permease component
MVAYFVRRLVGGVLVLMLSALAIFSLLVYWPGGVLWSLGYPAHTRVTTSHCFDCVRQDAQFLLLDTFELEKPWPGNFISWLFDTKTASSLFFGYDEAADLSVNVLDARIEGAGALTGDLGTSISFERGTSVTDLFGPGLGELLLAVTAAIFLLMAVAVAQRLRHPAPYALNTHPTTPDRPRPSWVT